MSEISSAPSVGSAALVTTGAHDTRRPEQIQMHPADEDDDDRLTTSREEPLPLPPAIESEASRHLGSSHVGSPPLNSDVFVAFSSSFFNDVDKEPHDKAQPCVTSSASYPENTSATVEGKERTPVTIPPSTFVPPSLHCAGNTLIRVHSPPPTQTPELDSPKQTQSQHNIAGPHVLSLHKSHDGTADPKGRTLEKKMIFGHNSTPSATLRRRNYATTNAMTDYEADLTNKDRAKQKEAVKKKLAERVRHDWTFEWPRPVPLSAVEETHKLAEDGIAAIESPQEPKPPESPTFAPIIPEHQWKERDEWLSNASESGGEDEPVPTTASSPDTPSTRNSPYRFDTPDGVGDTVKRNQYDRKRRHKKRMANEMAWNDGLACFNARRDAWTGARRVPKSGLQSLAARVPPRGSCSTEGSSTANEPEQDSEWEDDIEIPIAPPIIPPENAMRASILPGAYNTIYDKVVTQQLTPSCPMNLKDVTRACVQGWKRDGEWPPKATPLDARKKSRKMSVAGLFGLAKDEKNQKKDQEAQDAAEKKTGFRRSIQKILNRGNKEAAKEGAEKSPAAN